MSTIARPLTILSLGLVHAALLGAEPAPAVTFTRQADRVRIAIGGRHFSDYVHAGWPKPCLYPILDADGTSYTRDHPFKQNPVEVPDHDWHRGVWFAYGAVNGHDLWRELPDKKPAASCSTRFSRPALARRACCASASNGKPTTAGRCSLTKPRSASPAPPPRHY